MTKYIKILQDRLALILGLSSTIILSVTLLIYMLQFFPISFVIATPALIYLIYLGSKMMTDLLEGDDDKEKKEI